MRPTKAVIRLNAISHNLDAIRQLAPNSKVMAVVKADAYGHGIVNVAKTIPRVDAFAVACIEEAVQLREGGVQNTIILLEGFFEESEIKLIDELKLETVIHHAYQVDLLEKSHLTNPLRVWLKLDSEMNRLGFCPEKYSSVYQRLSDLEQVSDIQLMTHFSNADDVMGQKTLTQLKCFASTVSTLSGEKTAANSAAVLAWPESHFEWVRPGIILYGCSPLENKNGAMHHLKPAMTLESQLISIKPIKKGQTAGYGDHWLAEKNTHLGIVAIGYGDGYPRHAKNGTPVWINGQHFPIAGRVSMDMIAVDLGENPKEKVGDRVVLWGDELPIETIAQWADTIPYTLLCGVTQRVKIEWYD